LVGYSPFKRADTVRCRQKQSISNKSNDVDPSVGKSKFSCTTTSVIFLNIVKLSVSPLFYTHRRLLKLPPKISKNKKHQQLVKLPCKHCNKE
ncbi:hypothetical protein D918_00432, partial [Trichuris suis]